MNIPTSDLRDLILDLGARLDTLRAEVSGLRSEIAAKAPAVQKAVATAKGPKPLVLALIGGGMHGTKALKALLTLKDCQIGYVCDVDQKKGAARVAEIKAKTGKIPKLVTDFRQALADPAVDGVVICTPHHWHALATVWALQAGKHVYVEKPVTHAFAEGPVLQAAARKYGKVVMPGTQLRSNTSLMAAGDYMRSGKLGPISLVHCIIHKDRPSLPMTNEVKVPDSVDYDLWLGPRPDRPVTRSKFHYHWHWFWDFGNGALGNNGIHRIDAARLALDLPGRGDLTLSIGGRFGQPDMSETPNTQLCLYRFGDTWVLQDVLGVKPVAYRGMENAVVFHGSDGVILYKSGVATLCQPDFTPISTFEGGQQSHYTAFLKAIRENKATQCYAALDQAITSSDLCHFGNISHRTGAEADDATILAELKTLAVPDFVIDRFHAMRDNIRSAGEGEAALTLGQALHMQEGAVPFRNASAEAMAQLAPEERAPFALPTLQDLGHPE
ncbi:MAG: Gfo/Idh/MocA family oxidoreductase [Paracoccaceae bacterium]